MLHPKFHRDTYSNEDVAELCRIGEITPSDPDAFRKRLEDIAAIFRWENAKFEDPVRNSDIARELAAISKQSARLLASLKNISADAELAIEQQVDGHLSKMTRHGNAAPDSPSLYLSLKWTGESFQGARIDTATLCALLGGLENAATKGAEMLPKKTPGQIRDYGLRIWMINIQTLWGELTEQPFSRDVTAQGEPITNAARFCVAAFQLIQPKYPVSRIMRELKACIRGD